MVKQNLFILFVREENADSSTPPMPEIEHSAVVDLSDLTRETLDRYNPDVVIGPLFARHFDGLLVAQKLHELNYAGKLRAVTPPLPNPHFIKREVAEAAPGLDFDFFVIHPDFFENL